MRVMNGRSLAEAIPLKVDTLSRAHLMEALQRSGIQLNASAQTLLDHPIFDRPAPQSVALVERSLGRAGAWKRGCVAPHLRRRRGAGPASLPRNHGPLPSTGMALSAERTRRHHVQWSSAHRIADRGGTSAATKRGGLPKGVLPPRHRWTTLASRLPLRPHLPLELRRPLSLCAPLTQQRLSRINDLDQRLSAS